MKIIRATTVPGSLNNFCRGLLSELQEREGYEVVALSSPGEALDEIREREKVRTIAVAMQRHISPVNDLRSLWKLIRVFRKEKPDMVHSMTPKAGLLCMLAAWVCRVPVRIHTFTGLVFPTSTGLKRKILMATDWLTCACATHVIPEGEGVKNDLVNNKITRKPLRILGYGNVRGIDLNRFDPKNPEVIKAAEIIRREEVLTFIFIGRLVGDKGILELVKAFCRLNKELPDTRLLLIGREEPQLDPLDTNTLKGISDNPAIEAVGQKGDVRPWLLASDVFVLPSHREGFPNVVIEAGAMGLPSIVTDINGSREIIHNGENGLIVPVKNANALYEAMKHLAETPEEIRTMAANARPMIASRFEQSFVRQCLKDYYKEILAK